MQIFAFDDNENLISALQAERKKDYICPECKGVVHARGGLFKRDHFYHTKRSPSCPLHKKSLNHLSIQLHFAKILPACALEVPFPSIKRIADCVWEEEKIIFEIQVSPISKNEVKERLFDYKSIGYDVVWILHDKTFNQKRPSSAEIFLKNSAHYYSSINLEGKGHIYDQLSHIKWGYFSAKSAPQPIDPTKPHRPPFPNPLRKHWSLGFYADFLQIPPPLLNPYPRPHPLHPLKRLWHHFLKSRCQ